MIDAPTADVVVTWEEANGSAKPPLIVMEGLQPYVPGAGRLSVSRIDAGHSNETFRVRRGGDTWVLRRPPRPPYAPTAHDVVREFRILSALGDTTVRVPRVVCCVTDETAIGAPFYLMEETPGEVIREHFPIALDTPDERRRATEEFVDGLVELHAVPWQGTELARMGRPGGYLKRQIRRWRLQWEHNATRPVPDIDRLGEWLASHLPSDDETTLVHGDYKLDNVIFAPGAPARLSAIVDWEMATLGTPLADVGLMVATWLQADEEPDEILAFSPATALPGVPARHELLERYALRTGRSLDNLDFHVALAIWKIAILLEGSYRRYLGGATVDPFFAQLADGVPRLARKALLVARNWQ